MVPNQAAGLPIFQSRIGELMTILDPLVVTRPDLVMVGKALGAGAGAAWAYKQLTQFDFKKTSMLKQTLAGYLQNCRAKNWYQARVELEKERKKAATIDTVGIVIRMMLFAGTSVLTYSYLRRSRSMLNILPRFEP